MLVGLVSDTHDYKAAILAASALLKERGVGLILHAGDIVSPFTAEWFASSGARFFGVFGNNDGERSFLQKQFSAMGEIRGEIAETDVAGRKVVLYHGTNALVLDSLAQCQLYDAVVTGHTHISMVERRGRTLVVNPGEGSGYLYGRCTLGIMDTDTMEAEIVDFTDRLAAFWKP